MDIRFFEDPYPHWIVDDFNLRPTIHVPPAFWPGWVHYDNDVEKKRTTTDFKSLGCVDFFEYLKTLAPWLSHMTGISNVRPDGSNWGGGIHVAGPGGFLGPHVDYQAHSSGLERRVNTIHFLCPDEPWREEWGGRFQLYDDRGEKVIKSIEPKCRRMVVWLPSDRFVAHRYPEYSDNHFHGCEMVTGPIDRVTAAMYYLADARPQALRKRALFVPRRSK